MKRLNHKLLLFIGFLVLIVPGTSLAQAVATPVETDFQVWNDVTFNIPLDKKKDWTLGLGGVWRIGNSVQTSVDERFTAVLMRRLNKTFSVGAGYVYRISNPSFRRRLYESRYQALGVINVPLPAKMSLTNRNILLYQSLYSRPDTSIYRTRFWVKRPVRIKERTVEPFVAFENFWDFRADAWVRNRIQVGATTKVYKNVSGDFFYIRQNEGGNDLRPGTLNGVGSSIRVDF